MHVIVGCKPYPFVCRCGVMLVKSSSWGDVTRLWIIQIRHALSQFLHKLFLIGKIFLFLHFKLLFCQLSLFLNRWKIYFCLIFICFGVFLIAAACFTGLKVSICSLSCRFDSAFRPVRTALWVTIYIFFCTRFFLFVRHWIIATTAFRRLLFVLIVMVFFLFTHLIFVSIW